MNSLDKSRFVISLTAGIFLSLPWLALSYMFQLTTGQSFFPFNLLPIFVQLLPANLITPTLEVMVNLLHLILPASISGSAKVIETGLVILMLLTFQSLLAGVSSVISRRFNINWIKQGFFLGGILFIMAILPFVFTTRAITGMTAIIIWLGVTSLAWGESVAYFSHRLFSNLSIRTNVHRRNAIGWLALASLSISVAIMGFGKKLIRDDITQISETNPETDVAPPTPGTILPSEYEFSPVKGTKPEITPLQDFYRVDINLLPPNPQSYSDPEERLNQRLNSQGGNLDEDPSTYSLLIEGLVEKPLQLSLKDLETFPAVAQYATLTCISNPVGGNLIGTTLFKGARLRDVLIAARLKPEAVDIKFTCLDGYTESLPVASAMDDRTLLCYEMGNQPLRVEHGAPIRLYTPGRYGLKNPKWIIKIEATPKDYMGFWQQRGWSENAWIKIQSSIEAAIPGETGFYSIGGMAFAGERGISWVEIKVDESEWFPTKIKPPLSALSWSLWRLDLSLPSGKHKLVVRAYDTEGVLQDEKTAQPHPDGASGYHSIHVNIK